MEQSRTKELTTLQALPLDLKIKKTQLRIKEAVREFGEDGLYLSFSGGKDSQVLYDIIKKMKLDIEVVHCDTGLEDDGTREVAKKYADTTIRPEMSFLQVIQKYGYPIISKEVAKVIEAYKTNEAKGKEQTMWITKRLTDGYYKGSAYNYGKWLFLTKAPFKISNKCCEINKEKPLRQYEKQTGKRPILAIMATESKRRAISWTNYGCNAFNRTHPTSRPMMFWKEQDVLEYIKDNNLKIAKEYGEIMDLDNRTDIFGNEKHKYKLTGANRTGCKFCMFGISLERDRLLKYKKNDPQFYDYALRGGGGKMVYGQQKTDLA